MKTECTELFLRYREVARLVWNLGFFPNPSLREWYCVGIYEEAMARLYEGIILRSLDTGNVVEESSWPGKALDLDVEVNVTGAEMMVDQHRPGEPGRIWGDPIRIFPGDQRLLFMRFFDWDQRGPLDFAMLIVSIQEMKSKPEWEGHYALVKLSECSIWFDGGELR